MSSIYFFNGFFVLQFSSNNEDVSDSVNMKNYTEMYLGKM